MLCFLLSGIYPRFSCFSHSPELITLKMCQRLRLILKHLRLLCCLLNRKPKVVSIIHQVTRSTSLSDHITQKQSLLSLEKSGTI